MRTQPAQSIRVATDAVIFTVRDDKLMALLIQMNKAPHEGKWAVPGGLIEQDETTEQAARRILKDQTAVTDAHLEQLAAFDAPDRDPLGRVVSVAYVALVSSEGVTLRTTEKYRDVRWWPVFAAASSDKSPRVALPPLAYDHKAMILAGVERLRAKLEYTNVAWSLLPREFTLSRLQRLYEIILGRPLDKRNFRRKILDLGIIAPTGAKSSGGAHRPAELFAFKQRTLTFVDVL